MTRTRTVFALTVIGAMLAAVAVQAQQTEGGATQGRRGGRPRGGQMGGPGAAGLLQIETVQKDLQLTEEQIEKIKGLGRPTRDNLQDLEKQVAEILKPEQAARLKQIRLQVAGAQALSDPEVAKALDITDEQRTKLREIQQQARESMRGSFQRGQDVTPEQRTQMREKMQQARKETEAKVLEVLTPQQREKLEQMKGAKIDIDFSQLRPRGPRPQ